MERSTTQEERRFYDLEYFLDNYTDEWDECIRCGATIPPGPDLCVICQQEEQYLEMFDEEPDTKGARRSAKHRRKRLGMVKHSPASIRSAFARLKRPPLYIRMKSKPVRSLFRWKP